ncbi:MAG: hypothetical protein HYR96_03900 [Deltaproteobacteria bacterium]|nr:hypothetical protein [Deltaproteobacteria bacterium]
MAIPAEAYASFFNNFLDQTKANPNNNSVACTAVLGKEKFTVNVSGLQHEIPDEVTPPTDADEAK